MSRRKTAPRAVAAADRNAARLGCRIRFFRSHLWENAGSYDRVAFNQSPAPVTQGHGGGATITLPD